MAKMFLVDLDGTLLNSRKEITPFTKDIIEQAAERGHFIVPATARGFYRIRMYTEMLDVDQTHQFAITFNGSVISDFTGEKLLDGHLTNENMDLLLEYIGKTPYLDWALYIESKTVKYNDIEDPVSFIRKHPVYKAVCQADPAVIIAERNKLDPRLSSRMEMTSSEISRMEFVRKGATKVNAIRFLMEHLGIQKEDTYAFGDGENDIGMLDFAGHGIAVANASEEVRKHADLITDDNNHDGVAKTIREILSI